MASVSAAAIEQRQHQARVLPALLCVGLPLVCAVFWPGLESAFFAPKAALAALFGVAATAIAITTLSFRIPQHWHAFAWAAAAYVAAVAISWLASLRRDFGAYAVLFVVAGPLFGLAIAAGTARRQRLVMLSIAFAAGLESVLGLAQWWLGLDPFSWFGQAALGEHRMRLFGTLGNPEFVANFLAGALPATFLLITEARGWLRAAWIALALLQGVTIVGTGCRASGIAAVVALAAFVAVQRGQRPSRRALLALAGALLVVLVVAASIVGTRNRHAPGIASMGRYVMWRSALGDGALRSPLGAGPGTFEYRYFPAVCRFVKQRGDLDLIRYVGYERAAESDFIQALNETGWIGFTTMVATFVFWGRALRRELRASASSGRTLIAASVAAVAALLTAATMEAPMQRADTWLLLWAWLALPLSLRTSAEPRSMKQRALLALPAAVLVAATGWFALQPVIASWHVQRGIQLEFDNQYGAAAHEYRAAIARDPTERVAHFNLTRTLAKAEQYREAWQASEVALRWDSAWELRLLRSRICRAQGDLPCALRELTDELELYPYGAELRAELAVVLQQTIRLTQ
jgi:hypothetical protein